MTATTVGNIAICPWTMIVDTREQAPWTFEGLAGVGRDYGKRLVVRVERRTLAAGDYSVEGFEGKVAVERKSLEDLYGTLGAGFDRFEREMEKLNQLNFAAIAIEADLREIWRPAEFRPRWHSGMNPRSVEGHIVSLSIDFPRVHWWPCGSRNGAMVRTFKVLEMFWRKQQICHSAKLT
jgi:ERCC4-type nuclease